jgi:hypothetical protein
MWRAVVEQRLVTEAKDSSRSRPTGYGAEWSQMITWPRYVFLTIADGRLVYRIRGDYPKALACPLWSNYRTAPRAKSSRRPTSMTVLEGMGLLRSVWHSCTVPVLYGDTSEENPQKL